MTVVVEVFYAPGCPRCAAARETLARLLDPLGVPWAARNVVEYLDRAVALGIRATPAVVVRGRLVSTGGVDEARLRAALSALPGDDR